MQKKNLKLALTSLALLGSSIQANAEEALQHTSLGTGQEIRDEIVAQMDGALVGDKGKEHKCGEGTCSDQPNGESESAEEKDQKKKPAQASKKPNTNGDVKNNSRY